MKNFWKKSLGILFAASMLAGCSTNTGVIEVTPEIAGTDQDPLINNEEPINLTVFSQLANWSGQQTGWGATLLKDMFNVELTIIPDANGTYETRMEMGDLGDIIAWGSNGDDYKNAVKQGKLFNWNDEDLVEIYGENFETYFPNALEANKELNEDGAVYGVGNNVTNGEDQHGSFIYDWGLRWDLYDQLGQPEVKNLDDLAEVLKQMQELEPTGDDDKKTYAASLWPDWDGAMAMNPKCLATAYYGYDELGLGLYNPETGEFYDALDEEGPYVEALRFYNKLYQQGLLDPDSMTQTYDTYMSKVKNGNVLMAIQDFAGNTLYNTEEHLAENKLFAPLIPEEARVIGYGISEQGEGRIWSIGASSMYPEKAMQLINWLYAPEGGMTTWYGIKGLMWDYDEDGKIYLTELGEACMNDNQYDLTGVEWTSPYTGETYTLSGTFNDGLIQINNTTWSIGADNPDANGEKFDKTSWESWVGDPRNEEEAKWRESTDSLNNQDYLDKTDYMLSPAVNFTEDSRSPELDLKWQQVVTEMKNGSWNMMYAKSDEEFDRILAQTKANADSYGYEECVEWCDTQAAKRFALQE